MKILIIGEYFSANLGDGVICETVKYLVEKNVSNAKTSIVDISAHTEFITNTDVEKQIEFTKKKPGRLKNKNVVDLARVIINKILYSNDYLRLSLVHKNKKNYIHNICKEKFDLAIFAGGQLFIEYFIFSISDFVKHLSVKNTPIFFNACGLGFNIKNVLVRKRLEEALNSNAVKMITTRDNIKLLKKYLKGEKKITTKKISDPAVWAADAYNIRKDLHSDVVGLGVMWLPNKEEEMINFWSNIIDELNRRNIEWKMFCNGCPLDYGFAIRILTIKGFAEEEILNKLSARPTKPYELVKLISTFKSIISFRLHSHIIAYSLDIPTIGIVWNDKLNFFADAIDCSARYFNINNVNSASIVEALKEAEYQGYNQEIKKRLKESALNFIQETLDFSNYKSIN